jgi:hypothetical protein
LFKLFSKSLWVWAKPTVLTLKIDFRAKETFDMTFKTRFRLIIAVVAALMLGFFAYSFISGRVVRFDGSFWRVSAHSTYEMTLLEMGGSRLMRYHISVTDELRVPLSRSITIKPDGYTILRYRDWGYGWTPRPLTFFVLSDGERHGPFFPGEREGTFFFTPPPPHPEILLINRVVSIHENWRHTWLFALGGVAVAAFAAFFLYKLKGD